MSESCWVCGEVEPEGGLRMTEAGDMVCRWVVPCARRIATEESRQADAGIRR